MKKYSNQILDFKETYIEWSKFEDSSFLITGATGLIGSCLVDILCNRLILNKEKFDIYALGRNIEKLKNRFKKYKQIKSLHFIEQDITVPLKTNIKFDFIINAASNAHPLVYANDPIGTITGNVFGLHNILEHARLYGCKRIIELSSNEIYGERENANYTFKENEYGIIDCNRSRAGYPESKRLCEALCQSFISQHKLDIVILRPGRIYGPTMSMDDSKATAQFIKKAINKENIVLKSTGEQVFSYAYVVDVASAILTLLIKGKSGEAYNVADKDSTLKLKELAEIVAEIGSCKVEYNLPNEIEAKGFSNSPGMILDCTKLEALGWSAKTHIKEGMRKTIEVLSQK